MDKQKRYQQIAAYIRGKIESKEWPVDCQIPSETALAEQFAVSRETVRHAIAVLVDQKLLERSHGKGTFVAPPSYEWNYLKMSFYPSAGIYHKLLEIKIIKADESLSKHLEIPLDEDVYELTRLRFLDNLKTPAIYEKAFFPVSLGIQVEKIDFSKRLYENIEGAQGIKLTRFSNHIEATMPTQEECYHLNLSPNSPLLLISRLAFSNDRPVIFTKNLVSDRIRLQTDNE